MVLKLCVVCEDEFEAGNGWITCGKECSKERKRTTNAEWRTKPANREREAKRQRRSDTKETARKRYLRNKKPNLKICEVCGDEFEGHGLSKTCGSRCQKKRFNEHARVRRLERRENEPGFKEYERRKIREHWHRQYHHNPEFREKRLKESKARHAKKYANSPAYRARRQAATLEWLNNNPEARERNKEYYREWRDENPERTAIYTASSKARHQELMVSDPDYRDRVRIRSNKRHALKKGLPNTLTVEQYHNAVNHFNGCCVVCGCQLDGLFGETKMHLDHWIPLAYKGEDNPGTVAGNMLPLCRTCNLSKNATLPDIWLRRKFSESEACKIEQRIAEYFDSVKES